MTTDKAALLAELAKGNPVDLDKIAEVERQLAELQRAGIVPRTGIQVNSPLGNPVLLQRRRVLANAVEPQSSKLR